MARLAGPCLIVAIGACAGVVETLESFSRILPADCGCAFILATHLDPDGRSLLPEIPARFTGLPVARGIRGLRGKCDVAFEPRDCR